VLFPPSVVEKYGNGGFIGLTRPDLYERMIDALPEGLLVGNKQVVGIEDEGDHVVVRFQDESSITTPLVVGADGINSVVREIVWGLPPIRDHNLHVIGGFTFDLPAQVSPREAIIRHSRTIQASHTGIRSKGRDGSEWWVLQAWDATKPAPGDLKAHALSLAKEFPPQMAELIANTPEEHIFRWPIRDRGEVPKVWSKGRVTFAGDAVHATSPYAAYGAGMSIVDGYFLGQTLNGVDLGDAAALRKALARYEELRVEHTAGQVKLAHMLGRNFHHVPAPMRPIRDAVFDHTKFLQKMVGDSNPAEISAQLEIMGPDLRTPAPVTRAAR
jgi:2-polyprenyl-6-methoxyphenol hydroxylase-like FAD-dependent oxidoreductase